MRAGFRRITAEFPIKDTYRVRRIIREYTILRSISGELTLHLSMLLVTKDRGISHRRHSRCFLLLYERIRNDLHDHLKNFVKKSVFWRTWRKNQHV